MKCETLTNFGLQLSDTNFNLSASMEVVLVTPFDSGMIHALLPNASINIE